MKSAAEEEGPKDPSKRAFLEGIAALGVTLIADEFVARVSGKPSFFQRIMERAGFGVKKAVLTRVDTVTNVDVLTDTNQLNRILKLPLESKERDDAEERYVARAQTLEQIDKGFEVVVNWPSRTKLLDKRYELREKGSEEVTGLKKLTSEEKAWAKENKVHPEVLAICTDAYFKVHKILEEKLRIMGRDKFMAAFRKDLLSLYKAGQIPSLNFSIEEMLSSPGVMVGIVLNETKLGFPPNYDPYYGFANIGRKPALSQLRFKNPNTLMRAKQGLNNLVKTLSYNGPLIYHVENIPGSDQDDNFSESGGDIGMQFRPDTAWELYESLKNDFQLEFNPFGVEAPVAAYLMLFKGDKWWNDKENKYKYRWGYLRGDTPGPFNLREEIRKAALERWNGNFVESYLEWGEKYFNKLVVPGYFKNQISKRYQ